MTDSLAARLLPLIIGQLLKLLSPELVRDLARHLVDAAENAVLKSENQLDDAFLPALDVVRQALGLPPSVRRA
ncbi:MAG: hypothetical protein HY804_00100 [Nitrospinae bacterium]|nr:hypothetical protein [Nitrospinota bacterium]